MSNWKISTNKAITIFCLLVMSTNGTLYEDDQVIPFLHEVGDSGGSCTCPNGKTYQVGDYFNSCSSLACINGTAGPCHNKPGPWSRRKVICGVKNAINQPVKLSSNDPQKDYNLVKADISGEYKLSYAQFGYDYQYWPVILLKHSWNTSTNNPFQSYFLISTQTTSFAITTTFGFTCSVENFCILTSNTGNINFNMNQDGSYQKVFNNAHYAYTTLGDTKPSDNIFRTATGTVAIIPSTSQMPVNWPFNAGLIGLQPQSQFFSYLKQSVNIGKEYLIGLKYKVQDMDQYYNNKEYEGSFT